MDIQAIMDSMMEMGRQQRIGYHLTLGDAISMLEGADSDLPVTFDHGRGGPVNDHSYRGYYSDLAFETGNAPTSVGEFRKSLQNANGSTYEGYKGGDYVMGNDTPLWNAEYSCCGLAIVGAQVRDEGVVLFTRSVD